MQGIDAWRNQLITDHAEVARRIALKMARRCPTWSQRDDLVAAGLLGLTEAAQRYDGSRAEPFLPFAEQRIRGAILDELRRGDLLPRRVRQIARRIASKINALETAGETASQPKLAEAMGDGRDLPQRARGARARRHRIARRRARGDAGRQRARTRRAGLAARALTPRAARSRPARAARRHAARPALHRRADVSGHR